MRSTNSNSFDKMLQHINCTGGDAWKLKLARESGLRGVVAHIEVGVGVQFVNHWSYLPKTWLINQYHDTNTSTNTIIPGIAWWDWARSWRSVAGSWPRWIWRWRRCPWPFEGRSATVASRWCPPRRPGSARWCRRGRSCDASSSGLSPSRQPWGWLSAGPNQCQTSPPASSDCWLLPPWDIEFKLTSNLPRTHLMAKTWSISQVIQSELSFSSKKSTPSCPANSGMYSIIARRTY